MLRTASGPALVSPCSEAVALGGTMPSTTRPLTWPTLADLDGIADCLGGEGGPMEVVAELQDRMNLLVTLDVAPSIEEVQEAIDRGAEPLTLQDVGAFASCLARLRFDLEWLLDAVRTM